jgi:hypothetical protein
MLVFINKGYTHTNSGVFNVGRHLSPAVWPFRILQYLAVVPTHSLFAMCNATVAGFPT